MASSQILLVFSVLLLNFACGNNMSNFLIFVDYHSTTSLLTDEAEWLNERVFYTYNMLRGFAASLTEEEANFLSNMPGVTTVLKDQATVQLPRVSGAKRALWDLARDQLCRQCYHWLSRHGHLARIQELQRCGTRSSSCWLEWILPRWTRLQRKSLQQKIDRSKILQHGA